MFTIRKHDKVKIISGKDRGKEGDVLVVERDKGRVLVAKLNLAKRHTRAQGQTEAGGIKDKELFLAIGKVMLICPDCKRPSRVKADRLADGSPVRICRKCGNTIPEPKKR